ncbi:MAG: hypothetical protein KF886_10625 [Candidatus Hydrogenedentes bacterium]|nr:hypothetical protein [Candidatus Hydrogenedentota bacterium]
MADRLPSLAELDALIESALRDEPLLPAPAGMHARIVGRVEWSALAERERARFRNALIGGLVAGVAVVAVAVTIVAFTNFHLLLAHGISGGLGRLDYYSDYYSTALQRPWPVTADANFLALALLLGAITVWVGVQPLLRSIRVHPLRTGEPISGRFLRTR